MGNIEYKKVDFNFSNEMNLKNYNGSSNKIDSQGVKNINEVNFSPKADNEYMILGKRVNIPYTKGIFGPDAVSNGEFGGDQGSLNYNAERFIKDPKVKKIVSKYYSNVDAEDLELLFYRMNKVGCGYIAAVNSLLFEYGFYQTKHSPDDFYNKFGFPIENFENGYNDEYLFLDFFLYYAKEHEGYKTIEEVYGNAKEQRDKTGDDDGALSNDKFKVIGMDGTYVDEVASVFQDYLKSKGINIKTYDKNNPIKVSEKDKERLLKELKQKYEKLGLDTSRLDTSLIEYSTEDIINISLSDLSLVMNVSADDFTLYYPEDKDGNGKYDDVYSSHVGSHAMTVVGRADEPGKVVVSSWGEEYIMDISEINNYAVYDYSDFNGVESSI